MAPIVVTDGGGKAGGLGTGASGSTRTFCYRVLRA
jgi:hypothetical protein